MFPAIVLGILVVGLVLIVFSRQSRPTAGSGEPRLGQHWHAAIATYACDENGLSFLPKFTGNLEEQDASGRFLNKKFESTGVHTHDDGVIHWHPYSTRATGRNADIGVFFDNYDVKVDDDSIALPTEQGGYTFTEEKSKCIIDGDEKDATVKLWVWESYSKLGDSPQVYTTELPDTRVLNDGMVFVLAFVPNDVDPVAPDWAPELLTLGAADQANVPTTDPETGATLTPDTTAASVADTTVTDSTDG